MRSLKPLSGVRALSMIALALTLGVTTVLALEVRSLRPQADQLRTRKALPYIGQWYPTVHTVSLAGDSVTIGETGRGRSQVLIYFSTTCPYCLETLPTWKRLSAELVADSARRFDVYWVSLSDADSTAAYTRRHDITYPVVRMPHWKINRLARVKGVPITLVIDRYGQIAHVHPSVFRTRQSADSVLVAAARAADRDTAVAASRVSSRDQ